MKFGTHTGGAAGEVCHLWLPCYKGTCALAAGVHNTANAVVVGGTTDMISHPCESLGIKGFDGLVGICNGRAGVLGSNILG